MLDTTFGGTGMVRYGADDSRGLGVAVDSQDRVLAGSASVAPFYNTAPGVTRLSASDGTVDMTFGGGTVSLGADVGSGRPLSAPVDLAALPGDGVAAIGQTAETTTSSAGQQSTRAALVVRIAAGGSVTGFTSIRPGGTPLAMSTYPDATVTSGAARSDGTVVLTGKSTVYKDLSGGGTGVDEGKPGTGVYIATDTGAGPPTVAIVAGSSSSANLPGRVGIDANGGYVTDAQIAGQWQLAAFDPALAPDTAFAPAGLLGFPGYGQVARDSPEDVAFDGSRRLLRRRRPRARPQRR